MSEFKLSGKNFDSVEEDISTLKELFPSIVTEDNEIDFDELREIFEKNGETIVDDLEEHYKFTWWGKKEANRVAKESTTKTLRPSKKDSKNWDSTENIYIEGDNLDALKILLGSYRNSIKMIYIDPPYNTGHDFVYKDNRTETEREHLENTGQLSEEGFLFENAKTDGKYHSNWLNMMYPRLYISRKLLTDDGVMFISIDDNEEFNLKKLCDEIFGESNFICNFVRKNKSGSGHDSKNIAIEFDYILCYAKNIEKVKINQEPVNVDDDPKYKLSDEFVEERGKYYLRDLDYTGTYSEKMDYPITTPDGSTIFSGGVKGKPNTWRWSEPKFKWGLENKFIEFKKRNDGWKVYIKQYQFVDNNNEPYIRENPYRALIDFSNGKGSNDFNSIMEKNVFSFPKPLDLIEFLQKVGSDSDSIILDFFGGSSSTAHSVCNRKFILIQIPEETDEKSEAYNAGYKNICEVGKERIRRAGDMILEKSNNKDLDVGFKVFKVDESNFIPWNPIINQDNVEQAILTTGNNIVDGRSELDLIYELLLKLNMELTCSIEEEMINTHKIYVVDEGYALICLDSNIDESIVNDLLQLKEELMTEYCQVILQDDALDDNSAINIYETLKTNNMEFHTI